VNRKFTTPINSPTKFTQGEVLYFTSPCQIVLGKNIYAPMTLLIFSYSKTGLFPRFLEQVNAELGILLSVMVKTFSYQVYWWQRFSHETHEMLKWRDRTHEWRCKFSNSPTFDIWIWREWKRLIILYTSHFKCRTHVLNMYNCKQKITDRKMDFSIVMWRIF